MLVVLLGLFFSFWLFFFGMSRLFFWRIFFAQVKNRSFLHGLQITSFFGRKKWWKKVSVTSENIPLTKKILRISQVLRPEDRSKGERGISNIEPIFQFFGKEETCETSFPKLDLSIMGTFKFLALHPSNSHKSKTGAHSAGHPAMFCHKIRNRYCENERRRKKHAVN